MLGSILETKFMGLGFIILPMVITTRDPGMKAENKALEYILFETASQNVVNGTVVPLKTHFTLLPIRSFKLFRYTIHP